MRGLVQLVIFRLDEKRYALPLAAVERIVRAAEVTPLPGGPPIVLGIINLAGRIVPLLNIRRRFGLKEKEISPDDHFLIANGSPHDVALLIDQAEGVITDSRIDFKDMNAPHLNSEYVDGVVKLDDGLALIHDPKKFLSLDETSLLEQALSKEVARGG